MKWHHLAGTTLLAACSSAAMAQSSVTLSGILDLGVRNVKNSGLDDAWSMQSGSNSTSRIVIRGTEDLGGGLSAGFHLEHGLEANTGNAVGGTQFWDRRGTVSLASKTLGELRLGRDFVPTYVNWSRYDPFSYVGAARSSNLISTSPRGPIRSGFGTLPNSTTAAPNTTVRANNAVQWLLPGTIAGLSGIDAGIMVSPRGGGTAAAGNNKVIGLRLGWSNPTWGVSAASTRTENDVTADEVFHDRVLAGHANLGFVRLSAAWRRFSLDDAKQTNLLLGAWIPAGAAGEVKVSWQRVSFDGNVGTTVLDANEATQIGLGYVHNLSKRTALYGTVSRLSNDGALTLTVPGGPAGMAAGGTSRGLEVGLRHNF